MSSGPVICIKFLIEVFITNLERFIKLIRLYLIYPVHVKWHITLENDGHCDFFFFLLFKNFFGPISHTSLAGRSQPFCSTSSESSFHNVGASEAKLYYKW